MNSTKFISVNSAVTASAGYVFTSIQIVADTKFHTLTPAAGYNHYLRESGSLLCAATASASAITWTTGQIIYGRFSTIQLHSGSAVLAYESI